MWDVTYPCQSVKNYNFFLHGMKCADTLSAQRQTAIFAALLAIAPRRRQKAEASKSAKAGSFTFTHHSKTRRRVHHKLDNILPAIA